MTKLSSREIEIIQYSAYGSTAKEIAKLIGLEHRTVEAYMTNIRKKLGAKNVAHVVFIACQTQKISCCQLQTRLNLILCFYCIDLIIHFINTGYA